MERTDTKQTRVQTAAWCPIWSDLQSEVKLQGNDIDSPGNLPKEQPVCVLSSLAVLSGKPDFDPKALITSVGREGAGQTLRMAEQ